MSAADTAFERLRARRSLADRLTDASTDVIGRGEYPGGDGVDADVQF